MRPHPVEAEELTPSRGALTLARRMFAARERQLARAGHPARAVRTPVTQQDGLQMERAARRQAQQAAADLLQEAQQPVPLDLVEMQRAWENGVSVSALARRFRLDPSEVGSLARNEGWPRKPEVTQLSLTRQLIELLLSNQVQPTELARLFGLSPERVLELLGAWGEEAPRLRRPAREPTLDPETAAGLALAERWARDIRALCQTEDADA